MTRGSSSWPPLAMLAHRPLARCCPPGPPTGLAVASPSLLYEPCRPLLFSTDEPRHPLPSRSRGEVAGLRRELGRGGLVEVEMKGSGTDEKTMDGQEGARCSSPHGYYANRCDNPLLDGATSSSAEAECDVKVRVISDNPSVIMLLSNFIQKVSDCPTSQFPGHMAFTSICCHLPKVKFLTYL